MVVETIRVNGDFPFIFNDLSIYLKAGTGHAIETCNKNTVAGLDETFTRMTHPGKQRSVLLAVREGHVDSRLLTSSLALCRRLEADLEIQVIATGKAPPAEMDDFLARLRQESQLFTLELKPSMRRRDLVDYANAHEHIVAVVIDSREGWEALAQDRTSDPWKRLECPLVTAASSEKK